MNKINNDSIVGLDWKNGVKSKVIKSKKGFVYFNNDCMNADSSISEGTIEGLLEHSRENDTYSFKVLTFETEAEREEWFKNN